MLDITKAYDENEEASVQVSSRWRKLIGFGCGYYGSYEIHGDDVIVYYDAPRNGGRERDVIPIQYFEMENEEEACKAWKALLEEQRKEKEDANIRQKEDREKAQFERLKKKYG